MKFLKAFFYAAFLVFAFLGSLLFGPAEYTATFKNNNIYKKYIDPIYAKLLGLTGSNRVTVGNLTNKTGSVEHRPPNEVVFQASVLGQDLYGGTTINTGSGAGAKISLVDGSEIILGENTTLLLEIPEGSTEPNSLTLNVTKGTVAAERKESSKIDLQVKTAGTVAKKVLPKQKIEVVAAPEFSLDRKPAEVPQEEPIPAKIAEVAPPPPPPPPVEPSPEEKLQLAREEAVKFVPREIPARNRNATSYSRRPASLGKVHFKKPPEDNYFSRAFYETRLGNSAAAKKQMAKALTRMGYVQDRFNDGTRLALDSVMEDYLKTRNCRQGSDTLSNVSRAYKGQDSAAQWTLQWKRQLQQSGCL